jgi:hypothetical protein
MPWRLRKPGVLPPVRDVPRTTGADYGCLDRSVLWLLVPHAVRPAGDTTVKNRLLKEQGVTSMFRFGMSLGIVLLHQGG